MTPQSVLADSIRASHDLLTRFLDGFDEETRTRQAPGMPNHVAWILGHCALTVHRVSASFDGGGLPEDAFIEAAATGDASRFGTESVSFGSTPADDSEAYPTLARSRVIFEAACDRLATAVEQASLEKLDEVRSWGSGEIALAGLVSRMCFHHGAHAGQILDLRRVLGLGQVIKPAS